MSETIFECICVFALCFGVAYFIGIFAGTAADEICSTDEEKKACNKAISKRSLVIALIVAAVGLYLHMANVSSTNHNIEQAQQEGIELVQDNPYEYIDNDVFKQYVADNIEDIKIDYDLVSYDDLYQYFGDEQTAEEQEAPADPASPTAYITPTGKRYHLSQSCAGKNAIETTVSKATEQGYTPCIKCAQ